MGVREDRAAKIVALVEGEGVDAIRFIRADGTVHVLALDEDRPARHKRLFGDGDADRRMRFMLGEVWSICAARFVRNRGGFDQGAQLVSHFPDEQLCPHCHTAFGTEHGHLIFEANQDDGRDPEQAGRLDDDLVTKGQTLR